MSGVVITGCGCVSSAGIGLQALVDAFDVRQRPSSGRGGPETLDGYELPGPATHLLSDLDPRRHLGRKGTAFLDRCTVLALIASHLALEDSGLRPDEADRDRLGVVLGTSMGSLRSMSDYTRETLVEERPYLVNPALFPNTVMNCAAGQTAIRHGLQGINATVAGGPLAFHNALRYAVRALRRGDADAMLVGAIEEFTPHRAWATRLAEPEGAAAGTGEGSAMFVVERAEVARSAGRRFDAEVLSVVTGFSPGGRNDPAFPARLEACVRRARAEAGVDEAAAAMPPPAVRDLVGECHAASGALEVAALLGRRRGRNGGVGPLWLVVASNREGGVGAAVLRSDDGARADRG